MSPDPHYELALLARHEFATPQPYRLHPLLRGRKSEIPIDKAAKPKMHLSRDVIKQGFKYVHCCNHRDLMVLIPRLFED